jgi:hypothetical protein
MPLVNNIVPVITSFRLSSNSAFFNSITPVFFKTITIIYIELNSKTIYYFPTNEYNEFFEILLDTFSSFLSSFHLYI